MKHKLAVLIALGTMMAATPAMADPFFTPIVISLLANAGIADFAIVGSLTLSALISGLVTTTPNGEAQILRRPK